MLPSSQRTAVLDELDHKILSCMRTNPRITNKALAEALAVAEATIASRIRSMENDSLMRVVAQSDYRALGYSVFATVDIEVLGCPVESVMEQLSNINEIVNVSVLIGSPAVIITVLATDVEALESMLLDRIGMIHGIRKIRCALISSVLKYESDRSALTGTAAEQDARTNPLPTQIGTHSLPEISSSWFDSTDTQIIQLLKSAGRTSNREVARLLGVSEGMVRQRLKKMEVARTMRLGLVADINAFGATAAAYIFVKIVPYKVREIATMLTTLPQCSFVGLSLCSSFDVVAILIADSRLALAEVIDNQLGMVDGVLSITARELVGTTKHSYDIIAII